eukprot:SAG22_NODE_1277_length_4907_cov_2.638311_6_plen_70_part_00
MTEEPMETCVLRKTYKRKSNGSTLRAVFKMAKTSARRDHTQTDVRLPVSLIIRMKQCDPVLAVYKLVCL